MEPLPRNTPGGATRTAPGSTSGVAAPAEAVAVQRWLDHRRNIGDTPDHLAQELIAAGWSADAAAATALRSLRSSDHHRLAYGTLTVSAGFAALAGATSMHLLLMGDPDPYLLAEAVTVFVAAAPIAVWSFLSTRSLEQRSAHAVWSPARRAWFAALALCTAIVGIIRLLVYVHGAALALTGATGDPLDLTDLAQVAVSVCVALPLYLWSYREWRRSALLVSGLRDPITPPLPPAGGRPRPPSSGGAPSTGSAICPPVPSGPWTPAR